MARGSRTFPDKMRAPTFVPFLGPTRKYLCRFRRPFVVIELQQSPAGPAPTMMTSYFTSSCYVSIAAVLILR